MLQDAEVIVSQVVVYLKLNGLLSIYQFLVFCKGKSVEDQLLVIYG